MRLGHGRRDGRRVITRIAFLLVLVVVVVLLLIHFGFMGSAHEDEHGCATCLTVLFAVLVLLGWPAASITGRAPPAIRWGRITPLIPTAASRDSPTFSVVLRL